MIKLTVEDTAPIPMTVSESFISGGGGSATLIDKTITANGTYNASDDSADGYKKVVAAVPNTYSAADEGKVVSSGALVSQSSQNIGSNGTYDTTLKNEVVVSVPNTYSAGDEGKVVSNGALVSQTSDTVTANDTYDTTLINSLTVNVSGGGRDYALEASLIGKTFSGVYSNSAVQTVGRDGLARMSAMTGVDLPNCTTIYDSCFRYSGLTSVYLPKAVCPQSHNYAFGNCTSLETAVLPATKGQYNLPLGFFNDTALRAVDLGDPSINTSTSFTNQVFGGCSALETIVLRYTAILPGIQNLNVFNGTPFANGGSGGTIYIPKSLYDHLGDGTSLDYKAATNWSTLDGYGTITWSKIEGSQYENYYVDGTPIPTP